MIAPVNPDDRKANQPPEPESGRAGERTASELGPHPLEPLLGHLSEFWRYMQRCLAIRGDRVKLQVRRAALCVILTFVAAVIGLTVLIVAAVILVLGISHGLTVLLGQNAWAGELLTGGGILALTGVAIRTGVRHWNRTSLRRTIAKYERHRERQSERDGEGSEQSFRRNATNHPH